MITLPPPTRSSLRIFWLLICLCAGFLISVLSAPLLSHGSLSLGTFLALGLALPGLLWPFSISVPYRLWNKLAREFARWARASIMAICYVIFIAVSATGTSLNLDRPPSTQSRWIRRGTVAPAAYISQDSGTWKGSSEKGWIFAFLSWAVRSGALWACCLLPFLVLLSAFDTEQEYSVPTNIYTLF